MVRSYTSEANKKEKLKQNINITDNHTWDEVCEELKKAMLVYNEESVKGFRGFFRKSARSFGDNSSTFKSWLDFLPTESHYLSILCGGLKLVLGVSLLSISPLLVLKLG